MLRPPSILLRQPRRDRCVPPQQLEIIVSGFSFPKPPTVPNEQFYSPIVPATVLVPYQNGVRAYLLLSCSYGPSLSLDDRNRILRASETGQFIVHWGDPMPAYTAFHARNARASLGKRNLRSLLEPYEEDETPWMQARLTPRRLPAAIVTTDPLHCFVWGSL
jgi:hypothetical protein